MLWKGRRESGNVDDRRGMGGPIAIGGGILGVIALVINLLMGGDPGQIINQQQNQSGPATTEESAVDNERASFVKTVLAETEDVWNEYFQKSGQDYQEPKLVLFRGATESGCGSAQ